MSKKPFSLLHDLHCHSCLSSCSGDPRCTPETVYRLAADMGYDTICLTDHLWDASVPGASDWYAPQDIDHVLSAKDAPRSDGVRCLLGCETEYVGGGRLGLAREHFDLFDFVVIPPNHMHMKGFVRPLEVTTPQQMADLFTCRLEEISQLDIPMEKVGIAHPNCSLLYSEGSIWEVISLMDEDRLHAVFTRFAQRGAGIEMNATSFPALKSDPDNCLRLYRIAKECGCKFYAASDSHSVNGYDSVGKYLPAVAEALGLTEDDRYIIP